MDKEKDLFARTDCGIYKVVEYFEGNYILESLDGKREFSHSDDIDVAPSILELFSVNKDMIEVSGNPETICHADYITKTSVRYGGSHDILFSEVKAVWIRKDFNTFERIDLSKIKNEKENQNDN